MVGETEQLQDPRHLFSFSFLVDIGRQIKWLWFCVRQPIAFGRHISNRERLTRGNVVFVSNPIICESEEGINTKLINGPSARDAHNT